MENTKRWQTGLSIIILWIPTGMAVPQAEAVPPPDPIDEMVRCVGTMSGVGLYSQVHTQIETGPGEGIVGDLGDSDAYGFFAEDGRPYTVRRAGEDIKVYPYIFLGVVTTQPHYCRTGGTCGSSLNERLQDHLGGSYLEEAEPLLETVCQILDQTGPS